MEISIRAIRRALKWGTFAIAVAVLGAGCADAQRSIAADQVQSTPLPKAYYVAEFDLKDPETFKPYHQGVPKTVADYGGIYLARGGQTVTLEGAPPKRIIIFEFPSLAAAQRWYNSPEYSALRPHRQRSGMTRNYIVESFLDKLPD